MHPSLSPIVRRETGMSQHLEHIPKVAFILVPPSKCSRVRGKLRSTHRTVTLGEPELLGTLHVSRKAVVKMVTVICSRLKFDAHVVGELVVRRLVHAPCAGSIRVIMDNPTLEAIDLIALLLARVAEAKCLIGDIGLSGFARRRNRDASVCREDRVGDAPLLKAGAAKVEVQEWTIPSLSAKFSDGDDSGAIGRATVRLVTFTNLLIALVPLLLRDSVQDGETIRIKRCGHQTSFLPCGDFVLLLTLG